MSAHADNSAEVPVYIVAPGEIFATVRKGARVVLPSRREEASPMEFDVLERGQVVERMCLAACHQPIYFRAMDRLLQAANRLERRES